ncbi:MAG: ABC transporter permease [Acidobacteriota bacterium]|nr:ABC transporter permease [Acidobacteriota bacterium]
MGISSSQLRQIFRRLRRTPMFTAIALFTLAAGIGANTAVFSVVEGVLLKPLPFPHSDRLVGVWHTARGVNIPQLNMGPSNYFVYREQSHTFQDIGLYQHDTVSVTGTGEPEQVDALDVTDGTLPILGIPPRLGRTFTREDVAPNAPKTAVLTYAYWQRKFGGKPSAVGQTLRVDGEPRLIVGVMPERFHFLDEQEPALLLPLQLDRNKTFLGQFSYEGVARLKPGATIAEANADVARMLPIVYRTFPAPPGFSLELFKKANIGPDVHPLIQDVIGQVGTLLWVLMGSIGLVLLIACANVANLLLVRAEGRQQELTVRAALGATRGQIARELLLESLVLGLMGSVLGLGLAFGALRLLVAMAPSGLPRVGDIGIDGPVLLFTLGVSVLASLLFGAVPVFKYAGTHAGTGLREGGRTLSQSRERHRARNVLVAVQVALAFVLLVCSGLMIRTFRALTEVNPGFTHPAQVQTFRIYIPETEVKKDEEVLPMQQEMLRKVAALPGVISAGLTTAVPMDDNGWMDPIFAEDHSYTPGELPPICRFVMISPEFFHVMGTPLIAGRVFTWSEVQNEIPLAVVSAGMARQYWGSPAAALGKRIRVSTKDDWREVIGVVGDVHDHGMNKPPLPTVYWPLLQKNFESNATLMRRGVAFTVRSPQAGSVELMNELRQAIWSVDANLPLYRVHTADYYYQRSMARTSFTLVMLGIAGAMALLLGTVGLYGVIAYSVTQRTREIGIRMALGAPEEQLTGMFVRQGLLLTGIGVVCGLAAAIAVMRLMSSLLFNVNPIDPITYAAVMVGLAGTAFLASYLPSRRARAVDPVVALRAE